MSFSVWLCALYRLQKTFWLSPRNKYLFPQPSNIVHSRLPRSVDLCDEHTRLTQALIRDVIASAQIISLNGRELTQFHAEICDEVSIDLDIYQLILSDGPELTVNINAILRDDMIARLSSYVSFIRLFSSDETQLAFKNNRTDPNKLLDGNDSFLLFNPPAIGIFLIGVSDTANTTYGPISDNSDVSRSTRQYYLQASAGMSPATSVLRLKNILSTTNAVISGSVTSDLRSYMSSEKYDLNRDSPHLL